MDKSDIKRVIGMVRPDEEMELKISDRLNKKTHKWFAYKPVIAVAAGLVVITATGIIAGNFIGNQHKNEPSIASQISADMSKQDQPVSNNKADNTAVNAVAIDQNSKTGIPEMKLPENTANSDIKQAVSPNSEMDIPEVREPDNQESKNIDTASTGNDVVLPEIKEPENKTDINNAITEENKGIYIPKVKLPENNGIQAKMMGLIVYQNKIYLQSALQIAPENIDKLLGEKLGTTKSGITEWSKQEDYAVEFASTIGVQDVYTVKGYDKSFRIMACEKIGETVYAQFYECLNDLNVRTGYDIFGKLKMNNNMITAVYENFDSWNNGKNERKELSDVAVLNTFIDALNNSMPCEQDSLSNLWDDQSADCRKFIYITLKDGCEVQLRLFKDGYVYYNGVNMFFKVDQSAFDSFWKTLK